MNAARAARALASAASLLAAAAVARADVVDPSMPKVIVVGAPRGAAASDRVDGARTGRAQDELPDEPTKLWVHQVRGGLELAPVVDAAGDVILALTVPEVVKLTRAGEASWRARLGPQAAVAPPVLTSSGAVVVVTANGHAAFISPAGVVRAMTALGVRAREGDASPVALRDGGVAVAAGRALVALDGSGAVAARATLEERAVGALLVAPAIGARGGAELVDATLVTTETGAVYAWRPPAAPRRVGSFGGQVRRGAALADARTLLAVVDGRRLVALDLVSGVAHVRTAIGEGTAPLDGAPAAGPRGLAYAATESGLVVGVDAAGSERMHAFVERALHPPQGGTALSASGVTTFLAPIDYKASPSLVVDRAGRVAFARSGGRVGVVHADGAVALASEHVCSAPLAVVPAGPRRFVVACREGAVFAFGE